MQWAFLAESTERTYNRRVAGEWGSGLTDLTTESLIEAKRKTKEKDPESGTGTITHGTAEWPYSF